MDRLQEIMRAAEKVTFNKTQALSLIHILQPQDYALDEVVVKAERPFVKVENGRLGYNLSLIHI